MIGEKVGNWVIEKRLGAGSWGTVYLAREERTGRQAALKLLSTLPRELQGVADRLDQTMPALMKLKHENLVRFLGAGTFQKQPYYLMEYVPGPNAAFLLEEQGPLPWPQVLEMGLQVCRGLHHCYLQDIVHRDLKPANLLCSSEGVVKVADCGIQRCMSETSFTEDGTLIGSADYLSPEQAERQPPTRQSDLYSLGIMLYQLLTGRLPFLAETTGQMLELHRKGKAEPPGKYVKDVPAGLERLIVDLLQKNPAQRPASAALVEQRLLEIRVKQGVGADAESSAIRLPATRRENARTPNSAAAGEEGESVPWSRVLLLACLLLFVVALLIWGLWPASPETVLQEVRELVAQEAWNDAEYKLDRHAAKLADPEFHAEASVLRMQVKQALAARQSQRQAGAMGFVPPSSEGERLYRRGILEYYQGQPARARQTWEHLIAAFSDVPSQALWVTQARQALDAATKDQPLYQELADALARAEKEPPEVARRRLESLQALYAGVSPTDPKLQALLATLQQRLKSLKP